MVQDLSVVHYLDVKHLTDINFCIEYSHAIVASPKICSKLMTRGPFYSHGLTLIPAWISNYIRYNMWDEITYPFLNFNGATVEV